MPKKEDEFRLLFLFQFLYKFLPLKNNTHGGTYISKLADVFIKGGMVMKKKWLGVLMILTMALSFSTGAFAAETGGGGGQKDIVDTAAAAGDFKILAAALEKAGLVSTLKEAGPYTVFAPTDQAFEKLLKDLNITAEELLNREDLKDILLYHVLSGKVLSSDLKDGMKAKTLAGKEVTITLDPVKVNNSTVVKPDIEASNGVIHVIDTVLIP